MPANRIRLALSLRGTRQDLLGRALRGSGPCGQAVSRLTPSAPFGRFDGREPTEPTPPADERSLAELRAESERLAQEAELVRQRAEHLSQEIAKQAAELERMLNLKPPK